MALTILVVDDSPVMREILGVILGADGHEVWFADSVDRGLELLELTSPDVVLTDYNMPRKDGPRPRIAAARGRFRQADLRRLQRMRPDASNLHGSRWR